MVYDLVKLTREYRTFEFMSPWEGVEYGPTGDEKKGAS